MTKAIHTLFATHHLVADLTPKMIRNHCMSENTRLSAHVHSMVEPTDFVELKNTRLMVN
jgi:hypothetical protein